MEGQKLWKCGVARNITSLDEIMPLSVGINPSQLITQLAYDGHSRSLAVTIQPSEFMRRETQHPNSPLIPLDRNDFFAALVRVLAQNHITLNKDKKIVEEVKKKYGRVASRIYGSLTQKWLSSEDKIAIHNAEKLISLPAGYFWIGDDESAAHAVALERERVRLEAQLGFEKESRQKAEKRVADLERETEELQQQLNEALQRLRETESAAQSAAEQVKHYIFTLDATRAEHRTEIRDAVIKYDQEVKRWKDAYKQAASSSDTLRAGYNAFLLGEELRERKAREEREKEREKGKEEAGKEMEEMVQVFQQCKDVYGISDACYNEIYQWWQIYRELPPAHYLKWYREEKQAEFMNHPDLKPKEVSNGKGCVIDLEGALRMEMQNDLKSKHLKVEGGWASRIYTVRFGVCTYSLSRFLGVFDMPKPLVYVYA